MTLIDDSIESLQEFPIDSGRETAGFRSYRVVFVDDLFGDHDHEGGAVIGELRREPLLPGSVDELSSRQILRHTLHYELKEEPRLAERLLPCRPVGHYPLQRQLFMDQLE